MRKLYWVILFVFVSAVAYSQSVAPLTVNPSGEQMTVKELYSILNERERAINQRFELQDKAVTAALAAAKEAVQAALVAAKEAVAKAEGAAEKRFDSVNEFRGQLRDQAGTLASKTELSSVVATMEVRFKAVDEKLAIILQRQSRDIGNTEGATWLWGVLGAAGVFVIGALGLWMRSNSPTKS